MSGLYSPDELSGREIDLIVSTHSQERRFSGKFSV
jgi:hypothetical protein